MKRKAITKALTQEEQVAYRRRQELKDLQERNDNGSIPKNPTRLFKVGDPVKIGALENVNITEVLFDGLAYAVHYDYIDNDSHVQIRFYNNDIDSLMSKVYHSGVDFNPNYQRDLVWSMEQKLSLMDSIFNNIEIGKFTFIKHDYSPERVFYYEILDGKQRLSTICEFYEDRFAYRGKKFSELCGRDANHFTGFPIVQGEVGEITEQQIYKLFVKMNTSGTPVSKDHLDKIKSLIKF